MSDACVYEDINNTSPDIFKLVNVTVQITTPFTSSLFLSDHKGDNTFVTVRKN